MKRQLTRCTDEPELDGWFARQRAFFSFEIKWSLLSCLLVLLCPYAYAQYSVGWWDVSGGGGVSSGGSFSVSGTVGQPDAGEMSGGNYTIVGGFGSVYPASVPVSPILGIELTTTNTIMIYWPSGSAGFSLQESPSLVAPNWRAASGTVQDNGAVQYLIERASTGPRFYRLIK